MVWLRRFRESERQLSLFPTQKKPSEYQGYRPSMPGQVGTPVSVLIGAVIIAAAILLSTLITAVGTRFIGMESGLEDNVWLIDRLTGSVYRCKAPERGKAACDAEIATGSVGDRAKP
jgi:hypothetical protein